MCRPAGVDPASGSMDSSPSCSRVAGKWPLTHIPRFKVYKQILNSTSPATCFNFKYSL